MIKMDSIELKARAKINLSLDVLGKRADGYHDVKMIMQTVGLHDRVFIESAREGINVACNSRWVPSGSGNIAYKAAQLLIDELKIKNGVRIRIDKRIPVAAGLGGGSSDAAAVLNGLNTMFALGLEQSELMELGRKIGADVPFCIRGGTMLAEGTGEVLTELPSFSGMNIVLVKPRIGVSTAWVYKNLDLNAIVSRPDTDTMIQALESKRPDILAANMVNVLETVTVKRHSIIHGIKERLKGLGALGSMMSGSGPTVFGLFGDFNTAANAYKVIRKHRWDCFLTYTV